MMCHSSRRTQSWSHSSSQQHKVVQEVCTHDDQNTGNKTKNVDIVEMIRSMGLHAKNPSQIANVQEMSIVHKDTKPVFLQSSATYNCDDNLGSSVWCHGFRSLCSYNQLNIVYMKQSKST